MACRHPISGTLWQFKCGECGGFWCRSCTRRDVWMPFCTCEQEIGKAVPARPPQPMTTDNRDGGRLVLADWLSKSNVDGSTLRIELKALTWSEAQAGSEYERA